MLGNAEILIRLTLAALLSGVVGLERERLLWAAGIRTHMLVCVGACLIMIVSAFGFSDVLGQKNVVLDPSRVAAQVVSGIGFLGAGTILLRGEAVKGLTTAASLWAVAAVGLAVGGGLYVAAIGATLILLVILAGMKPLEERYRRRLEVPPLRILAQPGQLSLNAFQEVAGSRASACVRQFIVQREPLGDQDEVLISFSRLPRKSVEDVAQKLRDHAGVISVTELEEAL